jgi:uncharacterized protein (TIGR00730 family)
VIVRSGPSSVCVYCASSPGADPAFGASVASFGRLLARKKIRIIYGGGRVGLMGVLADSALAEGGEVCGVITRALEDKEVAHNGLSKLDVVDTMHERKAAMADAADAFVMLPGGFGTFEEFLEVVTWTQLGVHSKACGVLNVGGYFDPLVALFEAAMTQRFVRPEHRDMVLIDSDPFALLDRLAGWRPVTVDKWLDRDER